MSVVDMSTLSARSADVRRERKELTGKIRRQRGQGPYLVAELIEENDDTVKCMRVYLLVSSIWKVSEDQAIDLVESCDIPATHRVRELTVRERIALGERLRDFGRGRRLDQRKRAA